MHLFPVEVNRAPPEMLLRVPGIGTMGAYRIIKARKYAKLGFDDLAKMHIVLKRAKHFVTCCGKFFGEENLSTVKTLLALESGGNKYEQLSMFSGDTIKNCALAERGSVNAQLSLNSTPEIGMSALNGQL